LLAREHAIAALTLPIRFGPSPPSRLVPFRPGEIASADGREAESNAEFVGDAKPLGDGVGLELDRILDGELCHAARVGVR
jgi:hypothetical protein